MTGASVLAAVSILYALLARRLDRLSISAPIVFVATGLVLGPNVAGLLDLRIDQGTTLELTEVTLALLLFADASTIELRKVEGDAGLPSRLLGVGLPLTIALGALVARALFPQGGWAVAALVATILAPTDAALGMAVVTNRAVPARIRRALNVESGLNDGIATPFVTLFLALTISEGHDGGSWLTDAGSEIALALAAAIVAGGVGGRLAAASRERGWTSATSEQLAALALALLAFEGSVAIGGNGFVAAFAAGLLFNASSRGQLREAVEFTETAALFASFFVWTVFGVIFVGPVLTGDFHWTAVFYAVLSLTLIRMVPVFLSLVQTGLRRDTVAFIAWFGPRGLASVVFTLMAVEELQEAGLPPDPLVEVATWTILLSVVAHGLSAGPLADAYGARVGRSRGIPELVDVPEPRIRRRHLVA
jgi:sodium/hydrogen antiporter